MLATALAGSTLWAWRHPATLPWLLAHVPGLQAQGVQGSLASGQLQIDQLDWQLPAGAGRLRLWQLQIDGAGLVLWPRPGAQALLRLGRVQAARAQYDSPPPLQVDAHPLLRGLQASLALGADGGRLHRVDSLQGVLETGTAAAPAPVQVSGQWQIGTAAPLAMQGQLQARRLAAPAWQATLSGQGPLAAWQADLQLRGDAPATGTAPRVQAQATVQPFAAWPLGKLRLQTDALDLTAAAPVAAAGQRPP